MFLNTSGQCCRHPSVAWPSVARCRNCRGCRVRHGPSGVASHRTTTVFSGQVGWYQVSIPLSGNITAIAATFSMVPIL